MIREVKGFGSRSYNIGSNFVNGGRNVLAGSEDGNVKCKAIVDLFV